MKGPFDLALETELNGRDFYLKQVEAISDVHLRKFFTMLANDEERHYEIIKEMKKENYLSVETSDVSDVEAIFSDENKRNEIFKAEVSRLEAYEYAIEFEQKSIDLYKELAENTKNLSEKDIYLKLVEEEKRHRRLIENLMEHIRRPYQWVEDAEFNPKEEY